MAIWRKKNFRPVNGEPLILMTHVAGHFDVVLGHRRIDGTYVDRHDSVIPIKDVYAWANVREIVPRDKYAYFT